MRSGAGTSTALLTERPIGMMRYDEDAASIDSSGLALGAEAAPAILLQHDGLVGSLGEKMGKLGGGKFGMPDEGSTDVNIPSAEEEDADRRLRHRLAAVQAIRRTPEYSLSRRSLGYARPLTPDPSDLTISKRQWEKGIQRWRWRLRTIRVSSAVSGTPGPRRPRGGGYHRKERAPQQAIVSCGPPVRDAITSGLPEKRTDAQPTDHQIPSCDLCGKDTYALACEGCGIRSANRSWHCACPPGTGRYRGPR